MEATFIEGVKHGSPVVKAIAVKALHYRDLAIIGDRRDTNARHRAQSKYDVLVELWNELPDNV